MIDEKEKGTPGNPGERWSRAQGVKNRGSLINADQAIPDGLV